MLMFNYQQNYALPTRCFVETFYSVIQNHSQLFFILNSNDKKRIIKMLKLQNELVILNKIEYMSSKCLKCQESSANEELLSCGHILCKSCSPKSSFSQDYSVTCPSCSVMSILHNGEPDMDVNPDNYVVCLQCKSEVMSAKKFLASTHRSHHVVTVANVVHDVQKSLRKYQLSFDLENQVLYNQIECLSKQKRSITELYTHNCSQIRQVFQELKIMIADCEQSCFQVYENHALNIIHNYDSKIQDLKQQILRYESYVESIQHNLIKSNFSKCLAATQFYFVNSELMDRSLNKLINNRKNNINQSEILIQLRSPNLKVVRQLKNRFQGLKNTIWEQQPKPQVTKQNLEEESQFESYFERKRREIFNDENNKQAASSKASQPEKKGPAKQSKQLQASKAQSSFRQSFNIQGRIQNLRKTLKLADSKDATRSNIILGHRLNGMF